MMRLYAATTAGYIKMPCVATRSLSKADRVVAVRALNGFGCTPVQNTHGWCCEEIVVLEDHHFLLLEHNEDRER